MNTPAAVLLAASLAGLGLSGCGDSSAPPLPPASEDPADAAARGESRGPQAAVVAVRVTLVDPRGKPLDGEVAYVHGTDPVALHGALSPGGPRGADDASVKTRPCVAGQPVTLRLPAGHWVWMRARTETAVDYVRLRPLSGAVVQQRITLDDARRSLSVLLLDSDLRSSVKEGAVRLFSAKTPGRGLEVAATERTDAWGFVRFDSLAVGGHAVFAPGAVRGDEPPFVWRERFVPRRSPSASVGTIVRPAASRVEVTFDVRADINDRYGISSKLALRRLDDTVTTELLPGVLQPGRQDVVARLVPGRYRWESEPFGELRFLGQRIIDIEPATRSIPVTVSSPDAWTTVELSGPIEREDLPLRVVPDRVDDPRFHPSPRSFGAPRWARAGATVPRLSGEYRLLVYGRTRRFVSTQSVQLTTDELTVPVVVASELVVEWPGQSVPKPATVTVVATESDLLIAHPLLLQFGRVADRRLPVSTTSFVVPLGRYEVRCEFDDGTEAWSRTVDVDQPVVRLTVR